jgi:hypothetical protein
MTTNGYAIRELENADGHIDRISAVDADGKEICGAFKPVGHNYWQLYTTKLVAGVTGLRTPPHRECFWGDHGRIDSRAWIELLAALYVKAA